MILVYALFWLCFRYLSNPFICDGKSFQELRKIFPCRCCINCIICYDWWLYSWDYADLTHIKTRALGMEKEMGNDAFLYNLWLHVVLVTICQKHLLCFKWVSAKGLPNLHFCKLGQLYNSRLAKQVSLENSSHSNNMREWECNISSLLLPFGLVTHFVGFWYQFHVLMSLKDQYVWCLCFYIYLSSLSNAI